MVNIETNAAETVVYRYLGRDCGRPGGFLWENNLGPAETDLKYIC